MKYLLLLSLLACAGCSWTKPRVITAPCPPPPVVHRPELRFPKIKPEATLVDIVTALVLDTIDRDGYELKLQAVIDAYRPAEPARAVPQLATTKKLETPK